jgi:hypothetical protein
MENASGCVSASEVRDKLTVLKRPDHPPDRHARFRARRRDGKACYVVELGGEELQFLIRLHWLNENEASDRAAVGKALGAMVADAARR